MVVLEVGVVLWVIRLVWRIEREEPTEQIVPATDEEVELVE